jgi:quinohemoprotein ethanol dehydrogenase
VARTEGEFPKPAIRRRGTQAEIEAGARLFERNCSRCHTNSEGSGTPDLRRMTRQTHEEFGAIVLEGTRAQRGMVGFRGVLSAKDTEAIHAYLIDLAWWTYEQKEKSVEAR